MGKESSIPRDQCYREMYFVGLEGQSTEDINRGSQTAALLFVIVIVIASPIRKLNEAQLTI